MTIFENASKEFSWRIDIYISGLKEHLATCIDVIPDDIMKV